VHLTQRFNQQGVAVNCALLILASRHSFVEALMLMSWLLLAWLKKAYVRSNHTVLVLVTANLIGCGAGRGLYPSRDKLVLKSVGVLGPQVAEGLLHPTQMSNQQGVAVNCGLLILAQ
jgi:hypothetical protein